MANYIGWVLTNDGKNLLSKAIANETKINFTKFKVGAGYNPENDQRLTDLINPKAEYNVSSYNTKDNGVVEFIFVVSNRTVENKSKINEGFKISEMGIFAEDDSGQEILYAYNKGTDGDYLPVYTGKNAVDIVEKCIIVVDQAVELTIKVDNSLTYVTPESFDTYKEEITKKLDLKADKTKSITNATINNGVITLNRKSGDIELTIPSSAEHIKGILDKETFDEWALTKLKEFGIGRDTIDTQTNLNTTFKNVGIYVVGASNGGINGKTTTILNSQYDSNLGIQLGITDEDDPKMYVRAKKNGQWTPWKETGSGNGVYGYLADAKNISIEESNKKNILHWTTPNDKDYKGIKIVRKLGSYPTSLKDGTIIVNSTEKGSLHYEDTNLENGREYFYRLFTYNKQDVYNNDENAILKGTPQAFVTYTVIIDENNSNPNTAVTYSGLAEGMTPGWENWKDTPLFKNIRPCVLKNGKVQYYLKRDDRTKKENGENANLSGTDGDVMIEFPDKLAYKIERKGTKLYVSVTNNPHADDSWSYAGFMNYTNKQTYNKMYIGAYQSSSDYHSKSGVSTATNIYHSAFESGFKQNGGQMWSFGSVTLLQCLYLLIYKNLNSQTALGKGHTNGSDYTRTTGDTNTKKFCWGSQNDRERVVFLGLESFYGTSYTYIGGIRKDGSHNIILEHNNKTIKDTVTTYNYMKKAKGNNDLGFLNSGDAGGSENTYYCDYNGSFEANEVLDFGGRAGAGADAGAFYLGGCGSGGYSHFGSRFMYLAN